MVHPLFGGSTTGFVSRQRVERGSNDDWTSVIALRKIYGAVGELDLARYAINGENMMGKSVGRRISYHAVDTLQSRGSDTAIIVSPG